MKATRISVLSNDSGVCKYRWEQTIDEVILYFSNKEIYGDKNENNKLSKCDINIKIKSKQLTIFCISLNKELFNEPLFDTIETSESLWYIENNELIVQLSKMRKGSVWNSVEKDKQNDYNPLEIENMRKQMMLERFQKENPGFDFSNAEFNGNVPDPRNFMGGIKNH
ncbi:CS domain-containing protein [Cryptosporidium ryanae]|uniref:CS domain-containing protein n=1 Tax=Cryptosporidium ryanae TaxID=515981 RepID=UPI00351A5B8B|nr:CS domain-containing protein [Cryptosporidium ryanae]